MTVAERNTFAAFAHALRRESHVLVGRPDLMLQQLSNRLQWAAAPVLEALAPGLEERTKKGSALWLRMRTPLRESGALRLTLSGHTAVVVACAISPDSAFVVTASADTTCKIWNAATGELRTTLAGHTDGVTSCAVSPDSDFVVTTSGNRDRTCKIMGRRDRRVADDPRRSRLRRQRLRNKSRLGARSRLGGAMATRATTRVGSPVRAPVGGTARKPSETRIG